VLKIPLYALNDAICKLIQIGRDPFPIGPTTPTNEQFHLSIANIAQQTVRLSKMLRDKKLSLFKNKNTIEISNALLAREDCIVLSGKLILPERRHEFPIVIKGVYLGMCEPASKKESTTVPRQEHLVPLDENIAPLVRDPDTRSGGVVYLKTGSKFIAHTRSHCILHPAWMEIIMWNRYEQVSRKKNWNALLEEDKIFGMEVALDRQSKLHCYFNAYDPDTRKAWCFWVMPHHQCTFHSFVSQNTNYDMFNALMAQVILVCLAPLKKLQICHNDLKGDNVVIDTIGNENMQDSVASHILVHITTLNVWLRIPTMGKLCSLIDFGFTCGETISSHAPFRFISMLPNNLYTDGAQLAYSTIKNIKKQDSVSYFSFCSTLEKLATRRSGSKELFSNFPKEWHSVMYTRVSNECGNLENSYSVWISDMVKIFEQYVVPLESINEKKAMFLEV